MKTPGDYVVRTAALGPDDGFPLSHPLNPRSALRLVPLGDRVGLERIGISLGRIPPGAESFVPHAHATQEEFLFILEGEGEVLIGEGRTPVRAGDFVGFPTDGAAHQLFNTGDRDLVYLMGGQRTPADVAHFPTLGKVGVWSEGVMRYFDADAALEMRPEDFVVSAEDAATSNE